MNKAEIAFFKDLSSNIVLHLERLDKSSIKEDKEILVADILYQTLVHHPEIFLRVSETNAKTSSK